MEEDFYLLAALQLSLSVILNLNLFSALLLLDTAHMGRAEKGELQLASHELGFICHRHCPHPGHVV